jgi:hypothetical protein
MLKELNEQITIVRESKNGEWGLQIKQKVFHSDSFSTFLDIGHIYLEEYKGSKIMSTQKYETGISLLVNTEDIEHLIKCLGKYVVSVNKKKVLVSQELIKPKSNTGKYTNEEEEFKK